MTPKKPCPFCGSSPVKELSKVQYCQLHGDPHQDIIIRCKSSLCPANPKVSGYDEDNAIERWNKRA